MSGLGKWSGIIESVHTPTYGCLGIEWVFTGMSKMLLDVYKIDAHT